MALPNLTVPTYPDVPRAPGVPPVLRQAANAQNTVVNAIVPLVADAVLIARFLQGPQWGIFDQDGKPALVGDSVVAVDFRKENRISDYPIENGGFASYNKVATPYGFKLTFTQGGTDGDRAEFLDKTARIVDSLDLFNAVTPEVTYLNANPTHYDYRRTAKHGATLMTVDVWLEEVRQTATATFTNAQAPSGAGTVNEGTVQPAPIEREELAPPT